MPLYECPECGAKVKVAAAPEPGKKLKCPECDARFAVKGAPVKPVAPAKPAAPAARAAKPAAPVAASPPPPPPPPSYKDDDDVSPYGVAQESEEEKRLAELNKPKFGDVADKYKKSARGPASALLVLPTNLLIGEGALTGIVGVIAIMVGIWPLVFTDAPPSDEEIAEQLVIIFGGLVGLVWGSLICLGASKMQNLESYAWALAGSVLGILPLLAGVFAIIALRDPRVVAGFEEVEGAVEDGEDEDEEDEDDDEDDDDEDD